MKNPNAGNVLFKKSDFYKKQAEILAQMGEIISAQLGDIVGRYFVLSFEDLRDHFAAYDEEILGSLKGIEVGFDDPEERAFLDGVQEAVSEHHEMSDEQKLKEAVEASEVLLEETIEQLGNYLAVQLVSAAERLFYKKGKSFFDLDELFKEMRYVEQGIAECLNEGALPEIKELLKSLLSEIFKLGPIVERDGEYVQIFFWQTAQSVYVDKIHDQQVRTWIDG